MREERGGDWRAIRRQKRFDRKRKAALPLFATQPEVLDSVAPLPSVAALREEERIRHSAVRAQDLRRLQLGLSGWLRSRACAEMYFTMPQIAHMEAYCRRTYPSFEYNPACRADYWYCLLRELGAAQLRLDI